MFPNLSSQVISTIKTWTIVVLMSALVMMGLSVLYLNLSVIPILEGKKATLQAEKQSCETLLGVQSVLTEASAVDEKKVAQLPIRIERIVRELVPIKVETIKWRDSNESDCNSSMSKLLGFDFRGVFNTAVTAADRQGETEISDTNSTIP